MSVSAERKQALREPNTKVLLSIAATAGVLGIALSVTGSDSLAQALVLIGLVLMIAGLHRYGRLGPDAPIAFVRPKKKKRASG